MSVPVKLELTPDGDSCPTIANEDLKERGELILDNNHVKQSAVITDAIHKYVKELRLVFFSIPIATQYVTFSDVFRVKRGEIKLWGVIDINHLKCVKKLAYQIQYSNGSWPEAKARLGQDFIGPRLSLSYTSASQNLPIAITQDSANTSTWMAPYPPYILMLCQGIFVMSSSGTFRVSQWAPANETENDLIDERLILNGPVIGAVSYGNAINIVEDQYTFIDDRDFPGGPLAYSLTTYALPINVVGFVAYVVNAWLQDGLLLYRFFVIFDHNYWIALIPGALKYQVRKAFLNTQMKTPYLSVSATLAESAFLYSVVGLIFIITYSIAPLFILLRVAQQRAWTRDTLKLTETRADFVTISLTTQTDSSGTRHGPLTTASKVTLPNSGFSGSVCQDAFTPNQQTVQKRTTKEN
ncbi:hypothetical protein Clacol_005258 [Clathrus columnatus]|uniref:Uncharacterized protein n=1 Tax=Clathrus columnatus TaxID=1419009 RepID=A0AAV5A8S6_9AGAM|nr:hypothetical protein Clacol_005258 [Clathrus columnatus]